MKMFRNCFFLSLISIVIFSLNSRAQAAFDQVYRNQVFIPDIHSVQLFSSGSVLSMPVLSLGTDEQLVLKFDDLSGQVKNYNYTILHCDADWRESFVMQSEYLDGFAENPLDDYALSFNTSMDYVNYQLAIPNQQVRLNYSGNYILLVYEGNDREHPVLSRRFFVLDQQVAVQGQVKKATFDPFQGDNQEVDFSVLHRQLKIEDPFSEIRVVVMKNRRWDSAIRDLKPIFVRDNELVYDYDEQNVFPGGNEFRYFDMRSWKYTGENVDEIGFYQAYYHVRVMPDEIRSNKKYFEYQEMNGNFTVESQDRIQDPDTECDYAFVHFSLAVPVPLVGGTVHVFGALTNWTTGKGTAMSWDAAHKQYDLTLLLKQGYYNYEYVYVPEGATVADETVLEGSHFETENDYQIFVYYKGISDRYEQLVGFTQLNSRSF